MGSHRAPWGKLSENLGLEPGHGAFGLEPWTWSLGAGAWAWGLDLEPGAWAWSLGPGAWAWSLRPGTWAWEPGAFDLEPGVGFLAFPKYVGFLRLGENYQNR